MAAAAAAAAVVVVVSRASSILANPSSISFPCTSCSSTRAFSLPSLTPAAWSKLSLPSSPRCFRKRCLCVRANSTSPILSQPSSSPSDVKLIRLRKLFDTHGIDAYIIPSVDPHQSEFSADCFGRRAYISGFTGSAGTAVVTKQTAALWTDGRYFLQAKSQLGPEWQLMRSGTVGTPSYEEWLRDHLQPGSKVAIDPFLFSSEAASRLKSHLLENDHHLELHSENLVDEIWGDGRPNLPTSPLRVHDIKYAGVDVTTKLQNLRKDLSISGATAIILTMLDEIAWLFNLRGNDVPHSPVAYAYAVVELEAATVFTDLSKITEEVSLHLKDAQVAIKPYTEIISELKSLAAHGCKLWLDPSRVSVAIANAFEDACLTHYENLSTEKCSQKVIETANVGHGNTGPATLQRFSPVTLAKSKKNMAELEGMRKAHLRDAAALAEFWAWLEIEIVANERTPTEVEVADKLLDFRSRQSGFLDTSFDTISGSGPNGAVIHYRPEPETCRSVDDKHLFLLDSGGQYIDGTTDVTRTVHFGTPTVHEKECYTRVLKGHIAIDNAIFPEGTPGFVLDVLARKSLWEVGLDYRHGTGHGVGAALNVHEGPQSISSFFGNTTVLECGMIVSNEPGYYEDGSFGIRIENLLVVKELQTPNTSAKFLGFEKLTFVPIQTKLIDASLLSESEIEWINEYHEDVWEKISPLVQGNALKWLRENTRPFGERKKTDYSKKRKSSGKTTNRMLIRSPNK